MRKLFPLVFALLVLGAQGAWAAPVDKVDVCHVTGNGGGVTVQVDSSAWADHTSAHSEHEGDFLVDDGHPCPPEPEPTPSPTVTPIPPRLVQVCIPVEDAPELPALGITVDITLIPGSPFLLATVDADEVERLLEGFHNATLPRTGSDPCPGTTPPPIVPEPVETVTLPPVTVETPRFEPVAPLQTQWAVEAAVPEGTEVVPAGLKELPFTGVNPWLALAIGLGLIGSGLGALAYDTARRSRDDVTLLIENLPSGFTWKHNEK